MGSHVCYSSCYVNCCQIFLRNFSRRKGGREKFIHSFSILPPSRAYLNKPICVFVNKKINRLNLLVNVNKSSITIEFLKIILSFSHVIFGNLSFQVLSRRCCCCVYKGRKAFDI